jgi:hemin uptake protein HemP
MNTAAPPSPAGSGTAPKPAPTDASKDACKDAQADCGSAIPSVIDSDQVLQGRAAVVIAHRGLYYRLQATRQGKLILTK